MFAHMFMRFYVYLTKLLYKSPVNMLVNMHFALPTGTSCVFIIKDIGRTYNLQLNWIFTLLNKFY